MFTTMNCSFLNDLIIIVTRKGSQAAVVTATITMLYLFSIAQLAIGWWLLQSNFVDNGETRETIFIATFNAPVWTTIASVACTAATNILADGLLVSTTFTIPFRFSHLSLERFGDVSMYGIGHFLPSPYHLSSLSQRQVRFDLREQGTPIKQANSFSKGYTQVILYFTLRSKLRLFGQA